MIFHCSAWRCFDDWWRCWHVICRPQSFRSCSSSQTKVSYPNFGPTKASYFANCDRLGRCWCWRNLRTWKIEYTWSFKSSWKCGAKMVKRLLSLACLSWLLLACVAEVNDRSEIKLKFYPNEQIVPLPAPKPYPKYWILKWWAVRTFLYFVFFCCLTRYCSRKIFYFPYVRLKFASLFQLI